MKNKIRIKPGDYFTYKFSNETLSKDLEGKVISIEKGLDGTSYIRYMLAWHWDAPYLGKVGSEVITYLKPYEEFSRRAIPYKTKIRDNRIPLECSCDLIGGNHCLFHGGNFEGGEMLYWWEWLYKSIKDYRYKIKF